MNALFLTFCHESQELRRTVSYFKFLCHNLSFRIVVLAVTYRSYLIINILNILPHIAKNIKSNIRELEGALVRVIAYSDLTKEEITYELACEALKDIFQSSANNELNSSVIKEKVAQIFSVKMEDFQSKKRTRAIAYPRQIAMYLCRELTDMSLPKIGEEFGGRDHTTVIHACDKVASDIEKDEDIKNKINRIITDLKN